ALADDPTVVRSFAQARRASALDAPPAPSARRGVLMDLFVAWRYLFLQWLALTPFERVSIKTGPCGWRGCCTWRLRPREARWCTEHRFPTEHRRSARIAIDRRRTGTR